MKGVHDALKRKFKGRQLLFGQGFIDAKVVFVAENPISENGSKDLTRWTPQSEKLLNQLIRSAGINKNKTYFTTVLKHCPQPNKVPTSKEIKSYVPFLREELKTIGPAIVVTLGNLALNGIGLRQPLANIHGRSFNFGSYELFPTFHPETALKSTEIKTLLEGDFIKLKQMIDSKKT
ncbi:MAG: hypothetical protein A3B99_01580 [Candidatus Yanofskybacteria bacterium RIFCSPHIGHO2_02_FULL_44_12b]|nr:MAG: hypothetical protein A2659_04720 [Candidatus Yanofskybacteria bacterium RIFCSPHIGHO2_01_FULL_44_24]OGN16224.1 MAG: hypothetical protein A3B99_01580 [Candidatus Yanofskybacteria bacterium RIFCSPHIGHO2_02_FULL_44_12b]OGN25572.1 MAG: hypothetical protein A2925_05125 [Candidatus Yanofskybacteria bacterium RIFCSPLOWO2_01_FULL_44_22]